MCVRIFPAVLPFLFVFGLLASCDRAATDPRSVPTPAVERQQPAEVVDPTTPDEVAHGGDAAAVEGTSSAAAAGTGSGEDDEDAADDDAVADDQPGDETDDDEQKSAAKSAPKAKKSASKPTTKTKPGKPSAGLTMAQGKEIYTKRCRNCHGNTGSADTKMGKQHDIPAWTESGWKAKWPIAKIREITANGKAGTKMKAFSDKLSPEELDIVAQYARSLGK
jgi:mono/diheme cytochrome c family protein